MKTVSRGSLVTKLKVKLKKEASPVELAFYKILKKNVRHVIWQKGFNGLSGKMMFVDFYIPKPYKLIIEIDGKQHLEKENMIKDAERDEWLTNKGYKVLRIAAKDVYNFDIMSYLNDIYSTVKWNKKVKKHSNDYKRELKKIETAYEKLEDEGWIDRINKRTVFKK